MNNAGVGEGGSTLDIPAGNIRRQFEVNVIGPLLLTQGIAKQMVERKIAFFPVPLGIQLDPKMLHGLAHSTGGIVLRTHVDEEKSHGIGYLRL